MPGVDGVAATEQLSAAMPATRVLVLTISSDDESILRAMIAGASGYLLKDAPLDELVAGIRAAAAGESTISQPIAARMLAWIEGPAAGERAGISAREIEVLRGLAGGEAQTEVAGRIGLSDGAVRNHVASILAKLQMESRVEAAVRAAQRGII
jgi:DNA-binding NarL/FixJ family response regulator